jgi:hypothetical protein
MAQYLGEKIKALLSEAGVSYKSNSRSFVLACPKCSKRDKLYIRKSDGRFICWVCADSGGFKGRAEWCLAELTGKTVPELRKELYGAGTSSPSSSLYLDVQVDDWFDEKDEVPIFVPDELPEVLPDPGFRALDSVFGRPGTDYLASRGIPLPLALEYGIQYWPSQKSIVFPVTARGKLLGWQTRVIGRTHWFDEESGVEIKITKAITSVGLKKDRTFLFADRIIGDHAVLCEGPIDAIKCNAVGGNVASLGKAVSRTQLELLKHSGIKKLYLALDPDAFVESRKVLKELSRVIDVYDLRPPEPYEDIGDMPMEEVAKLAKSAPKLHPNHIFLYIENPYENH